MVVSVEVACGEWTASNMAPFSVRPDVRVVGGFRCCDLVVKAWQIMNGVQDLVLSKIWW